MILELQQKILNLSPALFPLLTFPLSFLQSWHCTMMCSPFLVQKNQIQKSYYLKGRLLSYTAAAAVFGLMGQSLRELLEIKALGALAFVFFLLITMILMGVWFGFLKKEPKLPASMNDFVRSRQFQLPSFFQGLLSVALPCGLLYQVMSLAALSQNFWGGALIGLAHGTASMPALWSGTWIAQFFLKQKGWIRVVVYLGFSVLLIFNLFYFAGHILYSKEESQKKVLFCF